MLSVIFRRSLSLPVCVVYNFQAFQGADVCTYLPASLQCEYIQILCTRFIESKSDWRSFCLFVCLHLSVRLCIRSTITSCTWDKIAAHFTCRCATCPRCSTMLFNEYVYILGLSVSASVCLSGPVCMISCWWSNRSVNLSVCLSFFLLPKKYKIKKIVICILYSVFFSNLSCMVSGRTHLWI